MTSYDNPNDRGSYGPNWLVIGLAAVLLFGALLLGISFIYGGKYANMRNGDTVYTQSQGQSLDANPVVAPTAITDVRQPDLGAEPDPGALSDPNPVPNSQQTSP